MQAKPFAKRIFGPTATEAPLRFALKRLYLQAKPQVAAYSQQPAYSLTRRAVLSAAALSAVSLALAYSGPRSWARTEARSTRASPFKSAVMSMYTRHSPGGTWAQLVRQLLPGDAPEQARARAAMQSVDRRYFLEPSTPDILAYQDTPLPIGYEQTISAPHMHATALELLGRQLHPGARVLDVGSGSGYLTAVFGTLVAPEGRVLGVEKFEPLAERSIKSIKASNPDLLEKGVVRIMAGNVLGKVLEEEKEPFDAIHVGAAAATLPDILVEKLARGGIMVRRPLDS